MDKVVVGFMAVLMVAAIVMPVVGMPAKYLKEAKRLQHLSITQMKQEGIIKDNDVPQTVDDLFLPRFNESFINSKLCEMLNMKFEGTPIEGLCPFGNKFVHYPVFPVYPPVEKIPEIPPKGDIKVKPPHIPVLY